MTPDQRRQLIDIAHQLRLIRLDAMRTWDSRVLRDATRKLEAVIEEDMDDGPTPDAR